MADEHNLNFLSQMSSLRLAVEGAKAKATMLQMKAQTVPELIIGLGDVIKILDVPPMVDVVRAPKRRHEVVDSTDVRAWARMKGLKVKSIGVLPKAVVEAYIEENGL